ncbi:MAG: hypothetical protein NTY06_03715 [Candidatus Gottesmanbacteria bacterium]|nr:hypothetical protein [Candidatus Gottesmanbacteria bacterium]
MAFRASTKSAKPKKIIPEAQPADEPVVVAPSLSIDDLIGGPKPASSAGKEEPKVVEPKEAVAAPLPAKRVITKDVPVTFLGPYPASTVVSGHPDLRQK